MKKRYLYLLLFLCVFITSAGSLRSQESTDNLDNEPLTLGQAVMCESIEAYSPENVAVVFSIGLGKVLCYTAFDHVPEETVIFHSWFRKDQLSSKRKLTLKPPSWSTFSGIQFRETDKGPWRVEISDSEGNILHILRFSITD